VKRRDSRATIKRDNTSNGTSSSGDDEIRKKCSGPEISQRDDIGSNAAAGSTRCANDRGENGGSSKRKTTSLNDSTN
jgi:hypothetical protein